jgi:hypothetical protein
MTKWIDRFAQALTLLCGEAPDMKLVWAWYNNSEDPKLLGLQDWAANKSKLKWSMGISVLEAAELLADHPEEGKGHARRGPADLIHEGTD